MAKKSVSIHPKVEVHSFDEDGTYSKSVMDSDFKDKPSPRHIKKKAGDGAKDQQDAANFDDSYLTEEERLQEAVTQAKLEKDQAYSGDALGEVLLEQYRELQNFKEELKSLEKGSLSHAAVSKFIEKQSKKIVEGKKLYDSTIKNGPPPEEKERVNSNLVQAKMSLDQYYQDTASSSAASLSDVEGARNHNDSIKSTKANTRPNNLNKSVMIAQGNEAYKDLPHDIPDTPVVQDAPKPKATEVKKEGIIGILKKRQGGSNKGSGVVPYSAEARAVAQSAERQ